VKERAETVEKRSAMKMLFWLVFALLIAAAIFILSDEFNRSGALASEGYIESGSKFGIEIGMSRDAAANKLASRGLEWSELPTDPRFSPQSCHGHTHSPERLVELWIDRSWRRGTICLSSEENKITSVSWVYNWGAP
jgi:hypothetical protein